MSTACLIIDIDMLYTMFVGICHDLIIYEYFFCTLTYLLVSVVSFVFWLSYLQWSPHDVSRCGGIWWYSSSGGHECCRVVVVS